MLAKLLPSKSASLRYYRDRTSRSQAIPDVPTGLSPFPTRPYPYVLNMFIFQMNPSEFDSPKVSCLFLGQFRPKPRSIASTKQPFSGRPLGHRAVHGLILHAACRFHSPPVARQAAGLKGRIFSTTLSPAEGDEGLESSASTNSRAHAGYQIRREGFLTYLRYASRLKSAKKVASGVFLSAIQATFSTVIGCKPKSRPAPAATQGCLNKAYSKSTISPELTACKSRLVRCNGRRFS